jgi:hypothetical protein
VNPEPYRNANKENVLKHFLEDGIDSLALYSSVSFCPIWAVYIFVLEEYPENEEVKRRLESCKGFYGF